MSIWDDAYRHVSGQDEPWGGCAMRAEVESEVSRLMEHEPGCDGYCGGTPGWDDCIFDPSNPFPDRD